MLTFWVKQYAAMARAKVRSFFVKENGEVNIIAMVILIVIAIGLAVLFRNQISTLVHNLFEQIRGKTDNIGEFE